VLGVGKFCPLDGRTSTSKPHVARCPKSGRFWPVRLRQATDSTKRLEQREWIESRQAQRLGSAKDVSFNVRILAASNRDLAAMVEQGQFRRDLFYRLNVTRLELPPLRARREDVPPLLDHFAQGFEIAFRQQFPGFTIRALDALMNYAWPGNVRELRNVVEELFVRRLPHRIDVENLPAEIARQVRMANFEASRDGPLDEKTRIVSALTSTRWNKKRAAERLCWSRMTLYRKMALHDIKAKGVGA
jgi:DNA-binding NtrC family response regulator